MDYKLWKANSVRKTYIYVTRALIVKNIKIVRDDDELGMNCFFGMTVLLQKVFSSIWIDNKSSYPFILKGYAHFFTQIIMTNSSTAWKVSVFEVFLVLIFPHSDWIRRDTDCLSVFGQNAVKHGPEKLRIWILFTQCRSCHFSNSSFFSK